MESTQILDGIIKNYNSATTVSLQIEAHNKNIELLNAESKKTYNKGYKDGKKDGEKLKIENLVQKN
jgi:hypothetical protein